MRIKSKMLTTTIFIAATSTAIAAEESSSQLPDTPAATTIAPTPSVSEELVYMRDQLAVQALRLDSAEQGLVRQQKLIELQEQKIKQLEAELQVSQATQIALVEAAQSGSFNVASLGTGGVHVVKSGDTLGAIASRNRTTVRKLAAANNIRSPYRLSIGQRVRIPGAPVAAQQAEARIAAADAPAAKSDENKTTQVASVEPATPQAQQVAVNSRQTPPGPQENPEIHDRAVTEQRRRQDPDRQELPTEVGVRPEDEPEAPYLALFSDVGGILTPKGTLYLEPALDFTASSDNRFFFEGIEIVDAVLIGAIEATDTDRLAITERLGVRYGLTNRIEIDASIPYVYREDRQSGVAIDDLTQIDDARFGSGLGDAAVGIHFQLNEGKKLPYFIANLRAKAPTGDGPFDVDRAPNGQELELATGSGFWTIEPSLSFIIPSAPASIFGNIGYQANLSVSPDQILATTLNESPVGPFDPVLQQVIPEGFQQIQSDSRVVSLNPGDAISASLGVGLSLNERLSMNFGYDHRYFFRTETIREETITTRNLDLNRNIESEEVATAVRTTLRQSPSTVGSFLFGASYMVNNRLRFNLNTGIGATDEAADFRVSLRAQIKLSD